MRIRPDPCRRLIGADRENAPVVPEEMTSGQAGVRALEAHAAGDMERGRQWAAVYHELREQETHALAEEEDDNPLDL